MKAKIAALVGPALLAGCAANSASGPAPSAPGDWDANNYDRIAFELKSWGAPVNRWEVRADGNGSFVARDPLYGPPSPPLTLQEKAIGIGTVGAAKLAALADKLPAAAPDVEQCRNRMTDSPYGTLTLERDGRSRTLDFNLGCFDRAYLEYSVIVEALDDFVSEVADKAPVTRTTQWTGDAPS